MSKAIDSSLLWSLPQSVSSLIIEPTFSRIASPVDCERDSRGMQMQPVAYQQPGGMGPQLHAAQKDRVGEVMGGGLGMATVDRKVSALS